MNRAVLSLFVIIVAVFGTTPASGELVNIALKAPYTLDPAPNWDDYPDAGDSTQLTDGRHVEGRFSGNREAVEWFKSKPVVITIDLGRVFGGKVKQYAEREGTKALERPLHCRVLSGGNRDSKQ